MTPNHSLVANVHRLTTKLSPYFWTCTTAVLLLWGLAPASEAQSPGIVGAIERAKKTVSPVVCMVRDANIDTRIKFRVFGTAFMIDKQGTFITANHIFAELTKAPWNRICLPAIALPVGGVWKRASQEVRWFAFSLVKCQLNERWDVAVCKTVEDMSKRTDVSYEVAHISAERPPDGTTIFFTGFPLQADDPITSVGSIAGFTASDNYNSLLIDKNAWPGASGSPIYLANGEDVVGMIERTGTGDSAGISFGVAGERLFNILSSARANWAKEENKQPEKP